MVTFNVKSATTGTPVFTATDTTDSVVVNQTVSVAFATTATSGANSTVAASPTTVTANGISTSTITVTLKNVSNLGVSGKTVTLASNRGAADTISAASGASDSSGVVTFTVKATTTGAPIFTATDASDSLIVVQTATVNFVAGTGNAANSTVTAAPAAVLADGSTTSTITVTLKDATTNPVSGKTVTLASSRGAVDTISAASGTSTTAGVVTFSVKSTTPGTPVFTATDATDSVVVTQTVGVIFTASSAKDILTCSFGTLGNASISGSNITLTVALGTVLTNLAPTFMVSPFALLSPASASSQDFTSPVIYTVTAQNGTTKAYTVIVQTYQAWAHSASMFILTTPDGANLPAGASETNFPLLVRLNASTFNFAEAKTDGADLRFSTAAGTALSYQIEQWDALNATAAVWVKIPAITGNARQEIKMYWGKTDAASESSGMAVFNGSNGYVTVMHLNDSVTDEVGTLTPSNLGATSSSGIIGKSLNFVYGRGGVIGGENITNYPTGNSACSTGFWFRDNELPGPWGSRFVTWGLEGSGSKLLIGVLSPPHIDNGFGMSCTGTVALGQWYHVVHTNSPDGGQKMYVNGQLNTTASATMDFKTPTRMYIGGWYGNWESDCDVDEVRISKVTRSADWIKLEYENQQQLQTLVGNPVQAGTTFAASPTSATLLEGTSTTLSAQAGGAQKVYWISKKDGVETVLATDQFTLNVAAGRVTGNQSLVIQFKAIYADGPRTIDIPVTITEALPDPLFTLTGPPTWDGRQTITVTPSISNMSTLQAKNLANLTYSWSVTGVAVTKQITAGTSTVPGSLTLTYAQGSGPLTVSLVLDNGGALVSNSKTITVTEPATDAWVQRTPAATEKVVNNQFIARDPNTNMGTIFYNGTQSGTPDTVYLKVYTTDAGDVLYSTLRQTPGTGGAYAFSAPINAGKVTYKVVYGTTTAGVDTPVGSPVTNLVCGDAYLIDGQSNALATDNGAPNDSTTDPWIRTYGLSGGWGYAISKGSEMQLGLWGWYLAKYMTSTYNMPVCFIQGAVGGTRIDQHQANPADHSVAGSLYSIYANIYKRVTGAKLTHGIRGVFWHQGESNSGNAAPTGDYDYKSYQQYFLDMAAAWKQDFPNLQRYIIYQVMPAPCSMGPKGDQLRDVQRTLPRLFSKMHILNTLGLAGYEGCHFNPTGYQNFTNLTAPLVGQDFYGIVPGMSVTAPILQRAHYTTTDRTEIAMEFDQDMSWSSFSIPNYWLDKAGGKVTSGSASGKVVKLQLSAPGTTTSTLDYLEDAHWSYTEATSSLLYGSNGIPALTFADVPIEASSPYTSWASDPAQGLTARVNDGPLDDPDHDGISNIMEFALGGAPLAPSQAVLPALTQPVAGTWVFEYDRSADSRPPATTQVVEYGDDLTAWQEVAIPATSSGSVTITPGSSSDHVQVIISNPGGRRFVRLKVSQ